MNRFKTALRAFFVILFNKDHVYVDNSKCSIQDSREGLEGKLDVIYGIATREVAQNNLLKEAKNILECGLN